LIHDSKTAPQEKCREDREGKKLRAATEDRKVDDSCCY
jgi:hypothetical protein